MRRFIYERSATNICDWSLADFFICTLVSREFVIRREYSLVCLLDLTADFGITKIHFGYATSAVRENKTRFTGVCTQ